MNYPSLSLFILEFITSTISTYFLNSHSIQCALDFRIGSCELLTLSLHRRFEQFQESISYDCRRSSSAVLTQLGHIHQELANKHVKYSTSMRIHNLMLWLTFTARNYSLILSYQLLPINNNIPPVPTSYSTSYSSLCFKRWFN